MNNAECNDLNCNACAPDGGAIVNDIEINRLIVDAWDFVHLVDNDPALPYVEQLIAVINDLRNGLS